MIVLAAALCLLKGLLKYVKALGIKHTFTLSVDIVIQATVSVYTSGSIVSSGEDRVLFS